MNMRTFHKLSQQILNDEDNNKENSITNTPTQCTQRTHIQKRSHLTKEQIINIKRMNARKIQEINLEKDKQIQTIKNAYQKQKEQLVQKYEKMMFQKQEYIKMLEELCSQKQNQNSYSEQFRIQKTQPKVIKNQQKYQNKNFAPFSQTLYLHQAPLYNQLCYTIQRPLQQNSQQISQFFATQKIKTRITSNEKLQRDRMIQRQASSSKFRSQSSTRNSLSKHGLIPACPPKYGKIL